MGGVNETGSTVRWRNEKERGSEVCGMQVTGRKPIAYGSEGYVREVMFKNRCGRNGSEPNTVSNLNVNGSGWNGNPT